MFDPSQIQEYRAIKAPEVLETRVRHALSSAQTPTRLRRVIPWFAAVAACLVLTVASFAWFQKPAVTFTVSPSVVTARSSASASVPIVELTIQANGCFTVDALGNSVTLQDGTVPALPLTAEKALTLWWDITSHDTTVTVNGRTYTLHVDPQTLDVTVS